MRIKKLFDDKKFIGMTLAVAVPIMIQNGITNFVGLLDNIMVGRIGTEQMSGISIVNQLLFVFNIAIFGAISGAGIFGAQFYGYKDHEGVKHTFRFKIYACTLILVIGTLTFLFGGESLIGLYLNGEGNEAALSAALGYGKEYLLIMLFGLLPFAVTQVYSSTQRECGETLLPMKAGIIAVLVNLALNYLLIFGKLGFPEMGVSGAALATVISRFVEMAIVVVWTHIHTEKMPFAIGLYKSLKMPGALAAKIIIKGSPLMFNEIFWAAGMAMLTQCYSTRGLDTVAALNISNTISNLFNVVFISMGNAVAIIIGQLLGAGKMEEARTTDAKLISFSVIVCGGLGAVLLLAAPLFPMVYNTSDEVKNLATMLLRISALYMPVGAYLNTAYFTLRSGGKTIVTFFFDSVFMWCVSIPAAFLLSRYTGLYIVILYLSVQMLDLIKCLIGYILLHKGVWINNIIGVEGND